MASRTATPGATATEKVDARAQRRPDNLQGPASALAVLETLRRDKLLEAVASAAKELLRSSDLAVSLPKVAAEIGSATGVDRAHIFLIDEADGDGRVIQHSLWTAPDITTPPEFRNTVEPMAKTGLKSWLPKLKRGEIIVGDANDFESPVRALLEFGGVRSTLCVPVFADGRWLGTIAFDDCHSECDWRPAEIDTIKTIAEMVGAAVARTRSLQNLNDANRIVESSSTILYRVSPQPPYPLTFMSQNAKRYGYKADELLFSPTRWQKLIKREDLPAIVANLKSVAAGKAETIRAEFRFRKPDGSWTWFEDNGRALRNADGRLIAIEGLLTDITERKSATHRRDAILEAVAASANELLRSSDLQRSLPKVIEWVGRATAVDRAHIFEVDSSTPAGRVLQHHMWSAPGIPTSHCWRRSKARPWRSSASRRGCRGSPGEKPSSATCGTSKSRCAACSTSSARNRFSQFPCASTAIGGGHLGFDDCRTNREWSPTEVDTLKTLAELVGAAVARTSHLKTLADANRIIENSPTILYRLSPQKPFELIYLSQNVRRYGYEADELLAAPGGWLKLIERESHPKIAADIQSLIEGKTEQTLIEFRLKKPDGSHAWFEGRGYAVRDERQRLVAIEGILTDITDRKRSENELSFSHNLLSTAIENSPDAIIVVDANDQIVMFNRHFTEMWELPPELVHAGNDSPILKIVTSKIKNEIEFLERVRYLYDHPEIQSHEEIEAKDGRIIERHSGSLFDAKQKYLGRVWFFRDITEKKRAAEKIATLARTDALTGLSNRAAFLERLNLEFARAKRGSNQFAVHYIDLDHFKDVNDTLGHPVGDKLLQAVTERLKSCIRETDMVARFGGDEFAILQDSVEDTGNIETLATKIGEILAAPFVIDGNQVQTTASIGIVPYRSDIADADAMMMKADLALYRAKNEGRNQFRFHVAKLDEQTRQRIILGEELRHAIARGEFKLFYQPQVELKSGSIVGLEALIRWNHPKRGLLPPAAFIPIAETTGSIVPIGEWVIEQACRQIKAWNDFGIAPLIVGVNLSGAQFKLASQLDQIVAEKLTRYGIAPERLELEITELVLIETTQRHSEAFERLRKLGVRFAIDDFGTGYSSLDYLRSFHVCRLKIDRSFIAAVTTSADDAAIVRATIGLAHELGIDVVAEGVETADQHDFLLAAGCQFAQGHFFGQPMPAAAATELLNRNTQITAI